MINATWAAPADTEANVAWARAMWGAQGFVGDRMYSNVMMAEDQDKVRR